MSVAPLGARIGAVSRPGRVSRDLRELAWARPALSLPQGRDEVPVYVMVVNKRCMSLCMDRRNTATAQKLALWIAAGASVERVTMGVARAALYGPWPPRAPKGGAPGGGAAGADGADLDEARPALVRGRPGRDSGFGR